MTKIQKESNSQHFRQVSYRFRGVVTYDKDTKRKQFTTGVALPYRKEGCCDLWQRYKKKAIHNTLCARSPRLGGVVTYDKDTKRKQFTTRMRAAGMNPEVLWPMTKIQKESNSQRRSMTCRQTVRCCDLWQRYKKKAIHNQPSYSLPFRYGVVTYDKDTKRKQFTTTLFIVGCLLMVLWPMTKIQKESNSQRSWRYL